LLLEEIYSKRNNFSWVETVKFPNILGGIVKEISGSNFLQKYDKNIYKN